jgi:TPR repeat protein
VQADGLTDALMPYVTRDYGQALTMLLPLARQGDAVAQLKLGIMYVKGKGVAADSAAAFGWFRMAAARGEPEAQYRLGLLYRDGLGTARDGHAALYWLEQAAQQDVPHAAYALGELYLGGHHDVPQDHAKAMVWFLRGANLGHAASMTNVGIHYALGLGVPKDPIEALKWFDLAAGFSVGVDRERALRARTALVERLTPVHVQRGIMDAEAWFQAHFGPHEADR